MEVEVKYKKIRWVSMPLAALVGSIIGGFIINYLLSMGLKSIVPASSSFYIYATSIVGSISGAVIYCMIVNTISPSNNKNALLIMILIFSLIILSGAVLDFTTFEREKNKVILGIVETITWIIAAISSYAYLYGTSEGSQQCK